MFDLNDIFFMKRALKLAKKGKYTTCSNPNVGCVIVKNNKIIGEGWHEVFGGPHAEINALSKIIMCPKNSTAYLTLEPCSHYGKTPPCCHALVEAGIYKVIFSMKDPNPEVSGKGIAYLKENGIKVEEGLLRSKAEKINKGFIKRMNTGLPYVTLKLGLTLDSNSIDKDGNSKWITSKESRNDVQDLRAKQDAIVTGSGTIIADDPRLTVRNIPSKLKDSHLRGSFKQPCRVIIDSELKISENANILNQNGKVLIYTNNKANREIKSKADLEIINVGNDKNNKVDILAVLKDLAKRGFNNVLIESGEKLAQSFLSQHLVDEIVFYISPKIIGKHSKSDGLLYPQRLIDQSLNLKFTKVKKLNGGDIKIVGVIGKGATK